MMTRKPRKTTAPGAEPESGRAPLAGPGDALGQAVWLMLQSPAHKHLFLGDLEWLVVPAILNRQFRLFRRENLPVAYASWAFVSEEVEQRLVAGIRKLAPVEWRGGDRAWLIDLAAPFGGAEKFLGDLKLRVFANRPLMTLRAKPEGGFEPVEVKAEAHSQPVATPP